MQTGRLPPSVGGNKGKSRPQKPQQSITTYSNTAYPETNYAQYTHGSNVNAHLKPVTYNSVSNSSMVAQAGTTTSSALTSRPHKAQGKSGSHKQQKQAQLLPSTYQAFEQNTSQQPLTSSVLAFNPATHPPVKLHRKKKLQAPQPDAAYHHNATNNSSLIIPVPQKAEWTHDAPVHKQQHKQHHRRHNGHVTAQQSMPSIVSSRFEGDSITSFLSPTHGQYDAKQNKAQGLQGCLKPTSPTSSIQQQQAYSTLPVLQSQSVHPYYYYQQHQQQQYPYGPQPPVNYPPQPDYTAIHSVSSSLPVVAATYLQQQPLPVHPRPQTLNNNTGYAQQPQQLQQSQYTQSLSHSMPGVQSMPHMSGGPGYGYPPQPDYGSQPTLAFGSESTIFGKPKKQVHFAK